MSILCAFSSSRFLLFLYIFILFAFLFLLLFGEGEKNGIEFRLGVAVAYYGHNLVTVFHFNTKLFKFYWMMLLIFDDFIFIAGIDDVRCTMSIWKQDNLSRARSRLCLHFTISIFIF